MNIGAFAWPAERLPEALDALCRFVSFPARAVQLNPPAGDAGRWLESAAATLGVEAEAVDTTYPDVSRMLRGCAPAIALLQGRALLIVARRARTLRILTPELKVAAIPLEELAALLRSAHEKEAGPQADALLDRAGITGRRKVSARAELLSARLGGVHVGALWLIRLAPGSDARRQLRGFLPRLCAVAGLYAFQFALWLVTWWLIGLAALQGRIDWGWLTAWALLRLSIIPLRVAVSWLSGTLAIAAGGMLKIRLLAGAMRLLPEETRSEGVGRLRVTDRETRDVAVMVFGGLLNKRLSGAISLAGQRAIGISASDGACFRAEPMSHNEAVGSLGFVGYLTAVDVEFLESLWRENFIPVASCLGLGPDGELYNINADHMAAACAEYCHAERLIFLTDVAGVLDDGKVLKAVSGADVEELIRQNKVSGGMILKLEASKRALAGGVREVRIVGGTRPGALISATNGAKGPGTRVVPMFDAEEVKAASL